MKGGQGQVQMGLFLVSWVLDAKTPRLLELSVQRFIFNNEYFAVVVILGNARLSLSDEIGLK